MFNLIKIFIKMKKTLLTLAAVATTFVLASCGSKDCVCDVQFKGIKSDVNIPAEDMDDCDDVKYTDLDLTKPEFEAWKNMGTDEWKDYTLVCEEK